VLFSYALAIYLRLTPTEQILRLPFPRVIYLVRLVICVFKQLIMWLWSLMRFVLLLFSSHLHHGLSKVRLTPVILAVQEAEIRRIVVESQPRQIVCKTLFWKTHHAQKWAGGVAQGVGPEFKPQCWKTKTSSKTHFHPVSNGESWISSTFWGSKQTWRLSIHINSWCNQFWNFSYKNFK
jgi:hypothetical protein